MLAFAMYLRGTSRTFENYRSSVATDKIFSDVLKILSRRGANVKLSKNLYIIYLDDCDRDHWRIEFDFSLSRHPNANINVNVMLNMGTYRHIMRLDVIIEQCREFRVQVCIIRYPYKFTQMRDTA